MSNEIKMAANDDELLNCLIFFDDVTASGQTHRNSTQKSDALYTLANSAPQNVCQMRLHSAHQKSGPDAPAFGA